MLQTCEYCVGKKGFGHYDRTDQKYFGHCAKKSVNDRKKNLALAETIQICADALYSLEHPPAPFPRQIFVEFMEMTISSVEFSFNDIMHRQIDGVAMGSPLRPALANIFVGYYKSKLFQTASKPEMYHRYMDDTFVAFSNKDKCDLFLDSLNLLHPSLRFFFRKNLTWLSHFWVFWLKNPLLSSLPSSIGNPLSSVNIYAGIPSVHRNAKPSKSWP